MQAISLNQPFTIQVVDAPEPTLGPEDVLIDVRHVGLCGTDLNSYRGKLALIEYPRILGHEVSGTISAKGDLVPDSIAIGSRVMVNPYTHCGICPACRQGRFNCCQFNQTLGVQRDGAMSERFAIHYTKVHASRTLSLAELALVEPLSVGYHAANRGRVSEIDTVLVIGCGTIGIGAIVGAARKGATVIALDVDDAKLTTAETFGATHLINSQTADVSAEIARITHGEGVSVSIEAVGLPATFTLAVEATAYAGRVVYIGYAKSTVTYDTTDFVRKELDILGSRNALRNFDAVIQMLERRDRPYTQLVSATYPLDQAGSALKTWDAAPGDFTKILLTTE